MERHELNTETWYSHATTESGNFFMVDWHNLRKPSDA